MVYRSIAGAVLAVGCLAVLGGGSAAEDKAQPGDPWRRLLLDDKVFTPEQLKQLEKDGAASDVPGAFDNFDQTSLTIYLAPPPKTPIPLDQVVKLYGKPDRVSTVELLDENLKEREADVHWWGPIGLVTRKGEKDVIALKALGALYKKGLKKAARE